MGSPSKVAEVFQTDNAGMSPSKVARPSPDSLVEMSLNNNVDRSRGSLVVKFHDRFVMLFLASSVGMYRGTSVGVSQGPVAEMSRSKSVARSVRTFSGAKSAAREEYKYLLLSTRLIWQILSLSVAQFNLHFNSPGGSCSYPISCY